MIRCSSAQRSADGPTSASGLVLFRLQKGLVLSPPRRQGVNRGGGVLPVKIGVDHPLEELERVLELGAELSSHVAQLMEARFYA